MAIENWKKAKEFGAWSVLSRSQVSHGWGGQSFTILGFEVLS